MTAPSGRRAMMITAQVLMMMSFPSDWVWYRAWGPSAAMVILDPRHPVLHRAQAGTQQFVELHWKQVPPRVSHGHVGKAQRMCQHALFSFRSSCHWFQLSWIFISGRGIPLSCQCWLQRISQGPQPVLLTCLTAGDSVSPCSHLGCMHALLPIFHCGEPVGTLGSSPQHESHFGVKAILMWVKNSF